MFKILDYLKVSALKTATGAIHSENDPWAFFWLKTHASLAVLC